MATATGPTWGDVLNQLRTQTIANLNDAQKQLLTVAVNKVNGGQANEPVKPDNTLKYLAIGVGVVAVAFFGFKMISKKR